MYGKKITAEKGIFLSLASSHVDSRAEGCARVAEFIFHITLFSNLDSEI